MNCTNTYRIPVLVRGGTAGICLLLCTLSLVLMLLNRAFQTFLRRLFLYLTIATMVRLAVLVLHIEHYFHFSGEDEFCEAIGFVEGYTGDIELLFAFTITLSLFYKVCETCKPHIKVFCGTEGPRSRRITLEILLVLVLFLLPFTTNWIPFILTPYGETGSWCWIKDINSDCSGNTQGFWEQMYLWYIPFILVTLCSVVIIIIIIGIFLWMCKSVEMTRQRIEKNIIRETLLLLGFLATFFTLFGIEVGTALYIHFNNLYPFNNLQYIFAVITPVSSAIIPTAFLLYLYSSKLLACLTKCFGIKARGRAETEHTVEQQTVGSSAAVSYPSETTTPLLESHELSTQHKTYNGV